MGSEPLRASPLSTSTVILRDAKECYDSEEDWMKTSGGLVVTRNRDKAISGLNPQLKPVSEISLPNPLPSIDPIPSGGGFSQFQNYSYEQGSAKISFVAGATPTESCEDLNAGLFYTSQNDIVNVVLSPSRIEMPIKFCAQCPTSKLNTCPGGGLKKQKFYQVSNNFSSVKDTSYTGPVFDSVIFKFIDSTGRRCD